MGYYVLIVLVLQLLCIFENADKVNFGGNEAGINLNSSIPKFHDCIHLNTSSAILPKYLPSGLLICTNATSLSHNWGLTCWSDPWFLFSLLASYPLIPNLLSLPFNFMCFTNFASHWHCFWSIPGLFQYPNSWLDFIVSCVNTNFIMLLPYSQVFIGSLSTHLSLSISDSVSPLLLYTSPALQANMSMPHYILCSYFCSCSFPTWNNLSLPFVIIQALSGGI